MLPADSRDRFAVALIALLVVLTPAVVLTLTLSFLTVTGDIAAGQLTPLELLELYLLDFAVLLVVGYLLYRLLMRLVVHELPASLDALEGDEPDDSSE